MREAEYEVDLLSGPTGTAAPPPLMELDLSPVETTIVSPHHIKLPTEIQDSEELEDQVLREVTREVNRFTEMLETKHMHSHMRAQMSSRKVQALKVMSEQLTERRIRAESSTLRMMGLLLQCVHSTLVDAKISPEQQEVMINALALKLEQAQKQENALKVTG